MTTPDLSALGMSAYEQRAWRDAVRRLNEQKQSPVRKVASAATSPVRSLAGKAWNRVPMHDGFEAQLTRALEGLVAVTLGPAMSSVSIPRVERRVGVAFEDFRTLDLGRLDRASPRTRGLYTGAALIEGSATALAVTGAEVAATVSAGTTAGVAIGAVATDAAASMALLGRIVALVAAEYGYDVRQPEEELFALGAISVGSASSPGVKVAALSSLSKLTQQMMRQATWAQLNSNALVQVIQFVFKSLGLRLTKQKLGQTVPVAGVLINGGLSAQMADQTYRRARDIYRLRFLSDKYDLDAENWVTETHTEDVDTVLGAALEEVDIVDEPDEMGERDD